MVFIGACAGGDGAGLFFQERCLGPLFSFFFLGFAWFVPAIARVTKKVCI